ncbi:MAG: sodium:calcium antiporter [Thermaurantimonas sp.]
MFLLLLILAGLLIGYGYLYLYGFSHILSERFKRQPAAVGFIILSALTSFPELITVVYSLQKKYTNIPIAAISGSNVFNFTMLLAFVLWRYKLQISSISREEDLWAQVFVAFIIFLNFLFVPAVHSVTFLILVILFIVYGYLVRKSIFRNQKEKVFFTYFTSKKRNVFSFVIGILMTMTGSIFLVESTMSVSTLYNLKESAVSTLLIGSFTSIPEVLLVFYLLRKNFSSLAVSTLTGSGVFNWVVALVIPMYFFNVKTDILPNINCIFSAYFTAIIAVYFNFLYRKNRDVERRNSIVLISIYTAFIIWSLLC